MASREYAFPREREGERGRLADLEEYTDPFTLRFLTQVGVTRGWRCADVGAGAGSVTSWLSRRVGTDGRVDAFDLDVSLVPKADNVTAVRCDITTHELTDRYDLIHLRFLLVHLADQQDLLTRLAAALTPGGRLVVVECDYASLWVPDEPVELVRVRRAYLTAVSELGWDTGLGARLPTLLAQAGLTEIEAEGFVRYDRGGSVGHRLVTGSISALRPRLVSTGLASEADVDAALRALADPGVAMRYMTTWACVGRRAG